MASADKATAFFYKDNLFSSDVWGFVHFDIATGAVDYSYDVDFFYAFKSFEAMVELSEGIIFFITGHEKSNGSLYTVASFFDSTGVKATLII